MQVVLPDRVVELAVAVVMDSIVVVNWYGVDNFAAAGDFDLAVADDDVALVVRMNRKAAHYDCHSCHTTAFGCYKSPDADADADADADSSSSCSCHAESLKG